MVQQYGEVHHELLLIEQEIEELIGDISYEEETYKGKPMKITIDIMDRKIRRINRELSKLDTKLTAKKAGVGYNLYLGKNHPYDRYLMSGTKAEVHNFLEGMDEVFTIQINYKARKSVECQS